ncbi:MAG: hypothetical protein BVN33_14565 [Proteobacteria bacterium ST_bin13]|nr:MAG: hypothetical protein BVN33_14565 [Proteobacteria bacterium ST_bin13]
MARGGARPGAGRKKGSVTKATVYRQEMFARAATEGMSPLDYLLGVMRDPGQDDGRRLDAAKAAAPFVHARLASIEHSGSIASKTTYEMTDDELAALALASGSGASESEESPPLSH